MDSGVVFVIVVALLVAVGAATSDPPTHDSNTPPDAEQTPYGYRSR